MENKVNQILIRRRNKVFAKAGNNTGATESYVCTMMRNVEALGYTFSPKLYKCLLTFPLEELFSFYKMLVAELKSNIGANVVYQPMYPNFPHSVMEADEAALYLNAIVHYWTNGTWMPTEEKEERLPLFEETKVTVLELGSLQDMQNIFANLCQSSTSLSKTDKEDLAWMFQHLDVTIPKEIPFKENAALLGKLYLENSPHASAKELQSFCKTATDILRLITALSDGDISLFKSDTRYRSFKRSERRLLLELLESCNGLEEDMLRYKNEWIRIGERLHPGEYKCYPRATKAFDKLRNKGKIKTFQSRLEQAFSENDYDTALRLLKQRPGEFGRKLDVLLRKSEQHEEILLAFRDVAEKVSVPVLLQVREHFLYRSEEQNVRVAFPKGSLARSHVIEIPMAPIKEEICKEVSNICEQALVSIFQVREFMGKVYLSPEFQNYTVPFSQRSASKALHTITRGSRLKLKETTKNIRPFIWWTNEEKRDIFGSERVDLDLSAAIFDEDWNCLKYISYTCLRSETYGSYHSGDITNGGDINGDGACEFIDTDINAVTENGGRYLVYQVYAYTSTPFCNLPHATFGWMEREDGETGEIFEPKTVQQKFDLASNSCVAIPVIFDCVTKEMIWCDMSLSIEGYSYQYGGNNIESNLHGVTATCYAMVNIKKPTLYDLVHLHICARGEEVSSKEEADVVFDPEEGITPYDTDVFMGQYL